MTDSVQAAIVDFTNTGDEPLTIDVLMGGTQHHVATLQPGESIRQVTSGDVEWCFSTVSGAAAAEGDDPGSDRDRALAEPGDGPGGPNGEDNT
jgi:hypothetical protein